MRIAVAAVLGASCVAILSCTALAQDIYSQPSPPMVYRLKCSTDDKPCLCPKAESEGFAEDAIKLCNEVMNNPAVTDKRGVLYIRASANLDLGNFNEAISDASAVIALDAKEDASKSIKAGRYRLRAEAYLQSLQDDKALADLDTAVTLGGETDDSLLSRASAYAILGKSELAFADYASAFKMNAVQHEMIGTITFSVDTHDHADAYWGRAKLYFLTRDYVNAASDFDHLLKASQIDPQFALWLHISKLHAHVDDWAEFSANVAQAKSSDWQGQALKLFLGQAQPRDVRQAALPLAGQTGTRQSCESAFAIAEWASMVKGDTATAKSMFQFIVGNCPRTVDTAIAKSELQSMR